MGVYGLPGGNAEVLVYRADIGPSADGTATVTVDQPLSAALYDAIEVRAWVGLDEEISCEVLRRPEVRGACTAVPIALGDLKPQLSADIEGTGTDKAIRATVRLGSTHVLGTMLRITVRQNSEVIALYDSLIRPDAQGRLNRTVRLPIPDVDASACIVAFTVQEEGISPPRICPSPGSGVQPDVAFDWVQIQIKASEGG